MDAWRVVISWPERPNAQEGEQIFVPGGIEHDSLLEERCFSPLL